MSPTHPINMKSIGLELVKLEQIKERCFFPFTVLDKVKRNQVDTENSKNVCTKAANDERNALLLSHQNQVSAMSQQHAKEIETLKAEKDKEIDQLKITIAEHVASLQSSRDEFALIERRYIKEKEIAGLAFKEKQDMEVTFKAQIEQAVTNEKMRVESSWDN